MLRMKKFIFIILLLFTSLVFPQGQITKNFSSKKTEKRTLAFAKEGQLICVDDYGNYKACTDNEFEKILGFCTNAPYVTVNKAKGDNKITEFQGIASFSKGRIKAGDYLCPCKKNPGQVVRCKKKKNPYAKALETPTSEGALFKVKILGHRRKY